jgi:hypothetical protein
VNESGGPMDTPRTVFRWTLWSWFLYRTGEKILYYVLQNFGIPHTPKWNYDHDKKFSDNMEEREKWKKKTLFENPLF